MRLGINKDGAQEYFWTTPDNYEITTTQVEAIRSLFKEASGTELDFFQVLRVVDLVKSGKIER